MRRRTAVVAVALATFVTSGSATAALAAAPYPPPATGQGTASPSRVKQGHCTRFTGDGFAPGAVVEIYDDSTHYGDTSAGSDGSFVSRVCFAGDARIGDHVLKGTGANDATLPGDPAKREVTATVTVVGVEQSAGAQAVDSSNAASTTALVTPFSAATLGLLLLPALSGLLLLMERRHRRRRRRTT